MIRRLLRLAILGTIAAALADRLLAGRTGIRPSEHPIRSSVVVDVPIDVAWAAISDIPSQPRWMREMKAVRIVTPGDIRVGTRAEAEVRIFGLGVIDPVEISAWEPPTRFAIRHLGLFRGAGEIVLEAQGDGATRITWDERLAPPWLPELGALVTRPFLERIFQDDLELFRALLESGAWGSGEAAAGTAQDE
jgi:uncharacterized membrane protein